MASQVSRTWKNGMNADWGSSTEGTTGTRRGAAEWRP